MGIQIRDDGDGIHIALEGVIDMHVALDIDRVFDELLSKEARDVYVRLEAVTDVTTSAFYADLLYMYRQLQIQGKRLVCRSASDYLREQFQVMRLARLLEGYEISFPIAPSKPHEDPPADKQSEIPEKTDET